MPRNRDRWQPMLEAALGPIILDALADPRTTEIMVNPDGRIWQECHGTPMAPLGQHAPQATEAVIRLLATMNQTQVSFAQPSLDAVLPSGARFKGFLPPRTKAPAFCIRTHQTQILTKEAYVPKACSEALWDLLMQTIAQSANLLIVGKMSSGKTTLLNSLMATIPASVRLVTIEDTAETTVHVPNHLQLYTSAEADLQAVVKEGFRTAAHRMMVGEIRDGGTALNTLKLWLGIGGGICTLHADSARDALPRLEYLCKETSGGGDQPLIGEVIDLIVFMEAVQGQRRIAEVLRIQGWNGVTYDTETLLERPPAGAAGAGVVAPA